MIVTISDKDFNLGKFKSFAFETRVLLASHLPIGKNAGRCPIELRKVIDVDDLPECESGMDGCQRVARTHAQLSQEEGETNSTQLKYEG